MMTTPSISVFITSIFLIFQVLFQSIFLLIQQRKYVLAIIIFQHRLRHLAQCLLRDPALAVSNPFEAGHLQSLTLLQHFDEGRCLREGVMRPGIKPRKASCHRLHFQLLVFQELLIDGGYLQLSTRRRLDVFRHLNHLVRIEIQADNRIVTLRVLRFLLDTLPLRIAPGHSPDSRTP